MQRSFPELITATHSADPKVSTGSDPKVSTGAKRGGMPGNCNVSVDSHSDDPVPTALIIGRIPDPI